MTAPAALAPPDSLLALPGVVATTTSLALPLGLTWEQYIRVGGVLLRVERASRFWIGDFLNYGERIWGDKYVQAVADIEQLTGLTFDPGTLANFASVASRVDASRRREDVPWSHHAEVAKLPAPQQAVWLGRAATDKLTHRQLRVALATRASPMSPGRAARAPSPSRVTGVTVATPHRHEPNGDSSRRREEVPRRAATPIPAVEAAVERLRKRLAVTTPAQLAAAREILTQLADSVAEGCARYLARWPKAAEAAAGLRAGHWRTEGDGA